MQSSLYDEALLIEWSPHKAMCKNPKPTALSDNSPQSDLEYLVVSNVKIEWYLPFIWYIGKESYLNFSIFENEKDKNEDEEWWKNQIAEGEAELLSGKKNLSGRLGGVAGGIIFFSNFTHRPIRTDRLGIRASR